MELTGKLYQNKRNGQITVTLKRKEMDYEFLEKRPTMIKIKKYEVLK